MSTPVPPTVTAAAIISAADAYTQLQVTKFLIRLLTKMIVIISLYCFEYCLASCTFAPNDWRIFSTEKCCFVLHYFVNFYHLLYQVMFHFSTHDLRHCTQFNRIYQ